MFKIKFHTNNYIRNYINKCRYYDYIKTINIILLLSMNILHDNTNKSTLCFETRISYIINEKEKYFL